MNEGFEWDTKKNRLNYEKHSISFEEASEIFKNPRLCYVDTRYSYQETRVISIGAIDEDLIVVLTVVHTTRESRIRIISARKASKKERNKYYEYLKKEIK